MRVSTDNLASTAVKYYLGGVREYGVPSRVRADGGSEFVHVESFMNMINGNERGSLMRGPSVHNQRIERLWRDVYVKVLDKYYKLFNYMEENNILDPTDQIDLYCLQHTFVMRIDEELRTWKTAHNNHGIRTEHYKTPNQLWIAGNLQNENSENTAMDNLFRRDLGGIEVNIQEFLNENLLEPNDIAIVLPRIEPPLTNAQLESMNLRFDVSRHSTSQGIDIYGEINEYVRNCLRDIVNT